MERSRAAGIILPGCAPGDQLPARIIIALYSQRAFAKFTREPRKNQCREIR
jgi:hypothetical protein